MTVEELFERLSYGELSNLAISNEGSGQIVADKQPQIVSFANEALRKIFARLSLKESEVLLRIEDHITDYFLDSKYSIRNTEAPEDQTLYILDSDLEPFQDDVIRILSVIGESGVEYPLNDSRAPCSMFTPISNQLQILNPIEAKLVSVIYQAKHPKLTMGNIQQEISIPSAVENPLQYYIAYKVYSAMNGQEASVKASEHLLNYENTILEIINTDSAGISTVNSSSKFEERGWV